MSSNLTISYELHPPANVSCPGLERTRTLTFPVPNAASGKGENSKYYDTLRAAILKAKDAIGDDFTAWRDAVGNQELSKEPSKPKKEDDEEEEEESEE